MRLGACGGAAGLVLAACGRLAVEAEPPAAADADAAAGEAERPEAGSDAAPVSGSATLDPAGGHYELAGVVLDVPPGAVAAPTDVTVTGDVRAVEGHEVRGRVFRFEPAGTYFAAPIVVTLPDARSGDVVYWTRPVERGQFEARPTVHPEALRVLPSHAVRVETSHFSEAFVAPPAHLGVTCTTRRRLARCDEEITVEALAAFWRTRGPTGRAGQGLASTSIGIADYFASPPRSAHHFASDDEPDVYRNGPEAQGVGVVAGELLAFDMDAARGGPVVPGCDVPLLAVSCDGSTTLRPGVPMPEAGPPGDAGDVGPDDAGADGGPAAGVTCETWRRVAGCQESYAVQTDVAFRKVPWEGTPGRGLASDATGLHEYFRTDGGPHHFATDATQSLYRNGPSDANGRGEVVGDRLAFVATLTRTGAPPPPPNCKVPSLRVRCRGTTTLR